MILRNIKAALLRLGPYPSFGSRLKKSRFSPKSEEPSETRSTLVSLEQRARNRTEGGLPLQSWSIPGRQPERIDERVVTIHRPAGGGFAGPTLVKRGPYLPEC